MEKKSEFSEFKSTADLTSNPGFQSSLSIATKGDEVSYNPYEHRNVEKPNSTTGSIIHFLKACLGTGFLAMPSAFKNAGLVVGLVGTMLAGIICTHTVHILVRTSQNLCIDAKKPSMSFSETCGAAFTYGPKKLRSWDTFVRNLVDYSLLVAYISVLCVYVVFISSSLKGVADVFYPNVQLSIRMYCFISLIPILILSQIRQLKYLVPFSAVANVIVLAVILITLYYVFTDLPPIKEREMVASVAKWPLFLSTVIFAMEGIGVMMPIENEMANPKRFLGCPGVLNISMLIIISAFGVVGFFGYVQYGDDVKGSVTLNLPEDDIIAQCTKLLMAFVIIFSYALQLYVPMEMITRTLKKYRKSNSCENLIQVAIRTVIVCFTVTVAAAFPNLELVIGFVGAIFFSTLGLLFPAVVDTVYLWDRNLGFMNYVLWKNLLIGIISIVCLVSGAYVSLEGMIEEFFMDHGDGFNDGNVTLTM